MIKIVWVGFHMEGVPAYKALAINHHIIATLSLTTDSAKRRSGVANYKVLSKINKINYFEISNINDSHTLELLSNLNPDIIIVFGWSQILSQEVLNIPRIGVIGAHASLLPLHRGSAPINWAIINGLDKTGNTLIWLNDGVDTGIIIDQTEFEITPYDSCKTLYSKVAKSNRVMLLRNMERIILHGKVGKQQTDLQESLLPRRKPSDGLISFNQTASVVYNFIRAIAKPYPGAFFLHEGKKYVVWNASFVESMIHNSKPGVILEHIYSYSKSHCGLMVSTKVGAIIIYSVEMNDKKLAGKNLHKEFPVGTNICLENE
jgi:methionyl-tRNA formyltransferase